MRRVRTDEWSPGATPKLWKAGRLTKRRGEGTCGLCLVRVDRLPRRACRELGARGGQELRKREGWRWTGQPATTSRHAVGWVCPSCSVALANRGILEHDGNTRRRSRRRRPPG